MSCDCTGPEPMLLTQERISIDDQHNTATEKQKRKKHNECQTQEKRMKGHYRDMLRLSHLNIGKCDGMCPVLVVSYVRWEVTHPVIQPTD